MSKNTKESLQFLLDDTSEDSANDLDKNWLTAKPLPDNVNFPNSHCWGQPQQNDFDEYDSSEMEIKQMKQKLLPFLKDNFYNTLFLYLKLTYMKHYYKRGNDSFIGDHLLNLNPTQLTFLDIMGYTNFSVKHSKLPMLIYIPPKFIKNYFTHKKQRTIEITRENTNVTNKLDLYFSLLTYFYYNLFLDNYKIQDTINKETLEFINLKSNEKKHRITISWLYESTIYNFSNIENMIKDFKYDAKDIRVNGHEFFKYLNEKSCDKLNDNFKNYDFMCHHLITIFRFYEEYILSYFFTHYFLYHDHPLELVTTYVK